LSFQQSAFQQDAFQIGVPDGAAAPFTPILGKIERVETPRLQGGYIRVPNLLITLLAAAALPIGYQQTTSATPAVNIGSILYARTFAQLAAPVGQESTLSAPSTCAIPSISQPPNLLLSTLSSQLVSIPIGEQQTTSATSRQDVLKWDSRNNTLYLPGPLPVGEQKVDSAPVSSQSQVISEGGSTFVLPRQIPQGSQETNSIVQTLNVSAAQSPNLVLSIPVAAQTIPIGAQKTDSSPPAINIGSILYSRKFTTVVSPVGQQSTASAPYSLPRFNVEQPNNVLTLLPPVVVSALPIGKQQTDSIPSQVISVWAQNPTIPLGLLPTVAALPIGEQKTDSAPYAIFHPQIDRPQNLLAGPLGLPPIASSQSESSLQVRPHDVYLWIPPNVTINLPTAVAAIPIGKQQTTSATPSVSIGPILYSRTTAPVVISPVGNQSTASAPYAPLRVGVNQPNNLLTLLPPAVAVAIPIGRQQTDSAPQPAPAVQSYVAQNDSLYIPPLVPLPIGKQQTDSVTFYVPPVYALWYPNLALTQAAPPPIVTYRVFIINE
jgi:hypothetical protein